MADEIDERGAPSRRLSASEIDHRDPSTRTVIASGDEGMELRVRSHTAAQRVAALIAVATAISVTVLVVKSFSWLDLCDDTAPAACSQAPRAVRVLMVVTACVAAALGAAVAVYMARFARVGRIWRRSVPVAASFGGALVVWVALYVLAVLTN